MARPSVVALLLVASLAGSCDGGGAGPAAARPASACPPGEAEKLGHAFVPLCDPAAPGADAPWISAHPLGCTAGEHGLLGCPPVTALVAEPPTTRTRAARPAALMDAETAYRTCAMRFGGRLPTSIERARARRVQGLASVLAFRVGEGGRVRLEELPEWIADGTCDNPSLSGAGCRVARFPVDAPPNVPWDALYRCDVVVGAGTTRTDALLTDVGGTCPTTGDCLLRSPLTTRGDAVVTLACRPFVEGEHPEVVATLGAVRCVVPHAGLAHVGGAPR